MCVCDASNYRFLFLAACVTSHVCLCFGFVIVFVRSLLSHRVSLLSAQPMKRRGRASARASRTGGATVRSRCAVVSTPHTRANGPGETTLSKSKPPSMSFAVMNNLLFVHKWIQIWWQQQILLIRMFMFRIYYYSLFSFFIFFICLFDFGFKLLF